VIFFQSNSPKGNLIKKNNTNQNRKFLVFLADFVAISTAFSFLLLFRRFSAMASSEAAAASGASRLTSLLTGEKRGEHDPTWASTPAWSKAPPELSSIFVFGFLASFSIISLSRELKGDSLENDPSPFLVPKLNRFGGKRRFLVDLMWEIAIYGRMRADRLVRARNRGSCREMPLFHFLPIRPPSNGEFRQRPI
jgi:hypothetical protein